MVPRAALGPRANKCVVPAAVREEEGDKGSRQATTQAGEAMTTTGEGGARVETGTMEGGDGWKGDGVRFWDEI